MKQPLLKPKPSSRGSETMVVAASEGLEFSVKVPRTPSHPGGSETYVVGPKCDENKGWWICTTHGKEFPNNFDKDSHVGLGGRHVLAWFCGYHGPEVP